jgi:hypothetical protein
MQQELDAKQKEVFMKLKQQIPTLVKALQPEIKGKDHMTRLQAYVLLSHMIKSTSQFAMFELIKNLLRF